VNKKGRGVRREGGGKTADGESRWDKTGLGGGIPVEKAARVLFKEWGKNLRNSKEDNRGTCKTFDDFGGEGEKSAEFGGGVGLVGGQKLRRNLQRFLDACGTDGGPGGE